MARERISVYTCDTCGKRTDKDLLKVQKVGTLKGELCPACVNKLEACFEGLKNEITE